MSLTQINSGLRNNENLPGHAILSGFGYLTWLLPFSAGFRPSYQLFCLIFDKINIMAGQGFSADVEATGALNLS
jgi:hypothetical protein